MSEEKRIIQNKVVLVAMKSFVGYANRSTGISKYSDEQCAIEVFKILKDNHENYSPKEIETWLVLKAEWLPQFAKDVSKIAAGTLRGKRFNFDEKNPLFIQEIIDIWRTMSEDPEHNSEELK
ncbi:MAG TPA: hypothetical protein VJ571_02085 [Candidatus Nitrosotalea sp.]|nr:hypothetical protein [Candidatus Nitrosotalea sp.]